MENKDTDLMQVNADEQFIKNYQAVYYAMNAKPDCKSKLFGQDVIISLQDLKDLNERVTDKFKAHYEDAGFRINVHVSFKNRESIEFDSWTTFEKYDFNIEKSISSILIVWEYNAKLPKYQLPQKHTLSVRIADEIRPEEMLNLVFSGKLEEVDKIDQEICPIVARVDFINSMLGDELLRIVELWKDGLRLPKNEQSKLLKVAKKYSRVIAYAINYITTFVALFLISNFIGMRMSKVEMATLGEVPIAILIELLQNILYSGVLLFVIYKTFQIIANIVFKTLRSEGINHIFDITNGDKKICQQIQKNATRMKVRVVINLIFTFLFNVICSIFANYIS